MNYLYDPISMTMGWLVGRRIAGQRGKQIVPDVPKEPIAYLYNGVRLPKLPEWDKEKYPYAFIQTFGDTSGDPEYDYAYWLVCMSASADYFYHSNDNEYCFGGDPYLEKCPAIAYMKLQNSNEWVFHKEYDNYFIERWNPVIWTNFDLDLGELKVDASEPIPVYE